MLANADHKAELNSRLRALIDHALEEKGISARAASLAVVNHDGLIRDIRNGNIPTADRLLALLNFLGIDFNIGEAAVAPTGFADPPRIFEMPEPDPERFSKITDLPPEGMFFVQPDFDVMGDLPAKTYCLVEPEAPLRNGDLVYLEDLNGGVNLGRFHGKNKDGWPIIHSHRGAMISEWNPARLKRLYPVTWTGRTPPPYVMFVTERPSTTTQESALRSKIGQLEGLIGELKKDLDQ